MEFTKTSNYTKALKIDASSWSIIKAFTSKEEYSSPEVLARIIKALPIPVRSLRPIEESISTVGGIKTDNLNPDYSWKNNGSIYCIGEMVNWDAPTGGFLLHGCCAMANHLAEELIKHKKAD
jgi:predicted flavoprotein YhiN